ncbi:MAG: Mg-protoporphyrin IX monomethyl ester oxidative cyclase, partial [Desulfocapsa sp.]
ETVEPGRFQFEIGIQSTNELTLAAIRRRIDPAAAHATVSRLAAAGNIHLHADLILGLPFEDKESYLRSFADAFAMGSQYIQMGLLKLLPDTAITAAAEEFGYIYCRKAPYSVLANKWLDAETLQSLYWFSECVEKFCNNRYFPSIWKYLRRINEDIALFFEQVLRISLQERLFQLAPTQQFLTSILMQVIEGREDEQLLRELLIFDWYRCGQKNLPPFLLTDKDEKRSLRDCLYRRLADDLPGLYTKKDRNRFFKQTIFHAFSGNALKEISGSGKKRGCLAFLLQREKNLARLQKSVLLSD